MKTYLTIFMFSIITFPILSICKVKPSCNHARVCCKNDPGCSWDSTAQICFKP